MESLLVDQSPLDARSRISGLSVHANGGYRGFAMTRSNDSPDSCSSLNLGTGIFGSYGSRLPLMPRYTSLPAFFCFAQPSVSCPPLALLRPPLHALPTCSKSVTLPLPSKKTYAANNVNSAAGLRVQSKKRKPRTSSKKEAPLSTLITAGVRQPNDEPKKTIQKANALSETEYESEEEEQEKGSLYSLSPPPRSLPLPSFALTRFKSAAKDGGRGAMHSGATYELQRILRL